MADKRYVFVLVASYDHESSEIIGVYTTFESAEKEQKRQYRLADRARRWIDTWDGESPWKTHSPYQHADSYDIQKKRLKP